MPTYSADVLASASGLNLGSSATRWNAFVQTLNVSGTSTLTGNVSCGGTLSVTGASTLTGNVTCSGTLSVSGNAGSLTGTFISATANPASAGVLRLASLDAVKARNATNNGDVVVASVDASNIVQIGDVSGIKLPGSSSGFTTVKSAATASGVLTLPAATDTLAGKATTDTFTNKTLTGAASGNSVSLLSAQAVTGTLTGNSADQTVFTYTIPANTIQAGKGFRYVFFASHTAGTAAITWKATLGGTNLLSSAWSAAGNNVQIRGEVYNVTAQTTQTSTVFGLDGATVGADSFLSVSENLANAATLKITFNVANTDAVIGRFFLVELIQ